VRKSFYIIIALLIGCQPPAPEAREGDPANDIEKYDANVEIQNARRAPLEPIDIPVPTPALPSPSPEPTPTPVPVPLPVPVPVPTPVPTPIPVPVPVPTPPTIPAILVPANEQGKPSANVFQCTAVVPNSSNNQGSGLQSCIDACASVNSVCKTLVFLPGVYVTNRSLNVNKEMVLRTKGLFEESSVACYADTVVDSAKCATIKAAKELVYRTDAGDEGGLLVIQPPAGQSTVSNVRVHHMIFDGNSKERWQQSRALQFPSFGYPCSFSNCANIKIKFCDNCGVYKSASVNGPGGLANAIFDSNEVSFVQNLSANHGGIPLSPNFGPIYWGNMPEAGISVGGNGLEIVAHTRDMKINIADNLVVDATDGGIVVATDPGRTIVGNVSSNKLLMRNNMMSGAMLLLYGRGSFGNILFGAEPNPSKTLLVYGNFIDCDNGGVAMPNGARVRKCPFGIQLGWHLWSSISPVVANARQTGGRIWGNEIWNAQVGINIDGAGSEQEPLSVLDNRVGGNTGLYFNKSPEVVTGNDAVLNSPFDENSGWKREAGNSIRQLGAHRYKANDVPPHWWGALDTSSFVGGDCYTGACGTPNKMPPKVAP
jgi:hypothetical protein